MSDATVNAGMLRAFIERIERVEEDIKSLNADKSEIYKELRGMGYDVKAVRQCVSARKLDSDERDERNAIFDLYWDALTGGSRVHVHEAGSYAEATGREPTVSEIEKVQPETATQFQAKASEDNGATGYSRTEAKADCMTGEVSRVDAGRTASATSEGMDVTAGETAPIPDEGIPAFLKRDRKPLRPNCLNPDNCAGYGSNTCHSCTVAAREVEPA